MQIKLSRGHSFTLESCRIRVEIIDWSKGQAVVRLEHLDGGPILLQLHRPDETLDKTPDTRNDMG